MKTLSFAMVFLGGSLSALADAPTTALLLPASSTVQPTADPTVSPAVVPAPLPAASAREITWHSFEGAGIMLTDGCADGLTFTGTAGQAEVGIMAALDADSDLSFVSGFWAGGGDEICAGDFNGDGELTPDDLADFITCYFSNPPCGSADVSIDGTVNPDDLADYIGAYFAGC